MLEKLKTAPKLIGLKQTKKAITEGKAQCVFLADDADETIRNQITELCTENKVELIKGITMTRLGEECGIDVSAATVAIIK